MTEYKLKYGCNPNQNPARIHMDGQALPFQILNGAAGYINLLDAFNSWQLVRELKAATGLPSAASFKHVSPAGAAVAKPLTAADRQVCFVPEGLELSPIAQAYVRARGCDRVSSFGDFAALSDECDASVAQFLVKEVSDGIIAPSYSDEALEILKKKRRGNYLIIQIEGESEEKLEDYVMRIDELCSANGGLELLVPNSAQIWKARKSFAEAVRHETLIHSNEDIVVPINKMPEAMRHMAGICEKHGAAARTASHAGDGNIHLSILQGSVPLADWPDVLQAIHHEIFEYVYPIGGKLSGEHGIGYKKKALFHEYTDPVELQLMQSIKKAWDPNLILNPGKVFDCQ